MTRTGKIARLPRALRDQLNRRLDNGESGPRLLAWLNAQPAARKVLRREFGGAPISKQNLSEWRAGGFAEWQAHQELLAHAADLNARARELEAASADRLSDHLATFVAARLAAALDGWHGEATPALERSLRLWHRLIRDIVVLRRGDHSRARLRIAQRRLNLQRHRAPADDAEAVQRWAADPRVRDRVLADQMTDEERRRKILEIYGRVDSSVTPPRSHPVQPGQTTFATADPEPDEPEDERTETAATAAIAPAAPVPPATALTSAVPPSPPASEGAGQDAGVPSPPPTPPPPPAPSGPPAAAFGFHPRRPPRAVRPPATIHLDLATGTAWSAGEGSDSPSTLPANPVNPNAS
jgi:hypothetical protein